MADKPKIFNIKGLANEQQARFRELAITSGKTHAELMEDLLSGKTVIESNGKTAELDGQINVLNILNNELEEKLAALTDSFQEQTVIMEFLENRIKELENDLQNKPEGLKLTGHQYVFEPASIQRNMQRCIAQMIRKGKINRHEPDILQLFTERAISYFIKNEYPEVLK